MVKMVLSSVEEKLPSIISKELISLFFIFFIFFIIVICFLFVCGVIMASDGFKFKNIKKFNGKTFKLATLGYGVDKVTARKTFEMNRVEGNYARIVQKYGKYATYVRKQRWSDL